MILTLAEFDIRWGAFEQEGAGGGGERAGQLNMCAETLNPSRGQI